MSVIVLGITGPLLAQMAQDGEIHGNVGITYGTKYVWRGYLVYGAKSAIHPFVDLDLMGSGFHFSIEGHRANASGYEEGERWDYTLYYAGMMNPEETWAMKYMAGYRYFNYPDLSSHRAFRSANDPGSVDLQELFAGVAFPKILDVPGLVPGYAVVKGWPSNSDTLVGAANPNGGTYSGWAHIFMLDYALPLSDVSPDIPEQVLNFHIETVFNDGVDPRPAGGYTESDWTHVMMGVSTDFDLGSGLVFTPALFHQVTFEDSDTTGVSPDHDMTWATMTLKYNF